jgi:membrane-associated phospholipid phosphatase
MELHPTVIPAVNQPTTPTQAKGFFETTEQLELSVPRAWDKCIAYILSMVVSPPVAVAVAAVWIAALISEPSAWWWAGLHIGLGILLPLTYIAWLAHRGKITDIDVQRREQRTIPMLFTLICTGLSGFILSLGAAPRLMIALIVALCTQSTILFLITTILRWKISVHSATASGVATFLGVLMHALWLPALIVPVIIWSRVRLRRHTFLQAVAGACLGIVVSLFVLTIGS